MSNAHKFVHLLTPIETVISQLPDFVEIKRETYSGVKKKAVFIDKEYGEFEAIVYDVTKNKKAHPKRSYLRKVDRYITPIEVIESRLRDGVTIDRSTYKNSSTKARFIDPVYGEFFMMPKTYAMGHNHPSRGKKDSSVSHFAKALEKIKKKLPENIKIVEETYKGYKSEATFIEDGREITIRVSSMMNKLKIWETGKPETRKPTPTIIPIEELKAKLPPELKIVEETYKGYGKKALFIDSEYGEWWTRASTILRGSRHPKRPKNRHIRTVSIDVIKLKLPSYLTIVESTYSKVSEKALFIDSEYGEWETVVGSVLAGHDHPMRSKEKHSYTTKEIKEMLPPEVTLVESTYKNTFTKAKFIDSEYGEFEVYPRDVIKGFNRHPREFHSRLEKLFHTKTGFQRHNKMVPGLTRQFRPDFQAAEKIFINTDGLRWHTERKGVKYHWDIREEFEKNGMRIFQFRENEIVNKMDIVKSIVNSTLGNNKKIFARQTEIREVPSKEAFVFFEENHLMGFLNGCKYYGLFIEGKLMMSVGIRFNGDTIDFGRLASLKGITVVGGMSKLISYLKERNPFVRHFSSWVDLRYSVGNSLKVLGFKEIKTTLGYSYTDYRDVYSRTKCRANMGGRKLSEREQALEFGWERIYDAGQRLFVLDV
jgi:hypothetical protein